MQTVSVHREIDAPAGAVREAMADREAFMRGGGFDEATVDGDRIHLANSVGLLTIELDLAVTEATDRTFVYEQFDGIFESMTTTFTIEDAGENGGGSAVEQEGGAEDRVTVVAETRFALDASLVGPILDATVIKRQRRTELEGHFDYLAARATDDEAPAQAANS